MNTEISSRIIPKQAVSEELRELGKNDIEVWLAIQELADWCVRHQGLLTQGRKVGFRLGATPMVKDLIGLACRTPAEAGRITGNIQDVAL